MKENTITNMSANKNTTDVKKTAGVLASIMVDGAEGDAEVYSQAVVANEPLDKIDDKIDVKGDVSKTTSSKKVKTSKSKTAAGKKSSTKKAAGKKSSSKKSSMVKNSSVPSVEEDGLTRYLQEIKKYPVLTAAKEKELARQWIENDDREAAHILVTSHLRLVAKIAFGYRGYGLPVSELISEGNIGLMQAVRKFEPEKGFRLSTYAMWWIKASIHDYILRSWSLVKIGTTAAQKKLFFNMSKAKTKLQQMMGRPIGDSLNPDQVKTIASNLLVEEKDVTQMEQRMAGGGDQSLSAPMNSSDGEEKSDWQSMLADGGDTPDVSFEAADLVKRRHDTVSRALTKLSPREQDIVLKRHLGEEVETLEDLSAKHGVSRERVRQIETRALEKLKDYLAKDYRSII